VDYAGVQTDEALFAGTLFLGHLGPDKALNVPSRPSMDHPQQELEGESVAYLVCARNGVRSKSETYLTHYVKTTTTIDDIKRHYAQERAFSTEELLLSRPPESGLGFQSQSVWTERDWAKLIDSILRNYSPSIPQH